MNTRYIFQTGKRFESKGIILGGMIDHVHNRSGSLERAAKALPPFYK
jgi:hypothetical protein